MPDSAFPRKLHRGVLGHSTFGIAKNTDKSFFCFFSKIVLTGIMFKIERTSNLERSAASSLLEVQNKKMTRKLMTNPIDAIPQTGV